MSITELTFRFTFVVGFFQTLFHNPFGKKLRPFWENKQGPKKKLTLSKVVTLNLLEVLYAGTGCENISPDCGRGHPLQRVFSTAA